MALNRNQTFHETLIPMLVEGLGVEVYLELGTHLNETIGKVQCPRRYGVDRKIVPIDGVTFFEMSTREFLEEHASKIAPVDFVFIDADHKADSVKSDFYGVLPYVGDEGLICMHDTNPETEKDTSPGLCGDAWRFAFDLREDGFECLTLPYHPGLTLFRKRITWGPR